MRPMLTTLVAMLTFIVIGSREAHAIDLTGTWSPPGLPSCRFSGPDALFRAQWLFGSLAITQVGNELRGQHGAPLLNGAMLPAGPGSGLLTQCSPGGGETRFIEIVKASTFPVDASGRSGVMTAAVMFANPGGGMLRCRFRLYRTSQTDPALGACP